jgi:hypothetical protein
MDYESESIHAYLARVISRGTTKRFTSLYQDWLDEQQALIKEITWQQQPALME